MNIESRLYGWLSCLNLLLIIVKLYTIFNNNYNILYICFKTFLKDRPYD